VLVVVQERVVEMWGVEGSVLLRCRDICGGCVNDDGMGVYPVIGRGERVTSI